MAAKRNSTPRGAGGSEAEEPPTETVDLARLEKQRRAEEMWEHHDAVLAEMLPAALPGLLQGALADLLRATLAEKEWKRPEKEWKQRFEALAEESAEFEQVVAGYAALVDKQAAWLDVHGAALDERNALDRAQAQLDAIRACLKSEKAKQGPKQKGELTRQRVEDQALVAIGENTELSFRRLVRAIREGTGDLRGHRKPLRIETHQIRRHLKDSKTVANLCEKGKKIIRP